ncbi:hypothetical protein ACFX10_003647 [Malus domestica]
MRKEEDGLELKSGTMRVKLGTIAFWSHSDGAFRRERERERWNDGAQCCQIVLQSGLVFSATCHSAFLSSDPTRPCQHSRSLWADIQGPLHC